MAMLTFLLVLLSATAYEMSYSQLNSRMQCEDLREQMCQGLPYKKTFFPNIFNHLSQEKASQVFSQYSVLITANCFRDMKLFLCSLFFPHLHKILHAISTMSEIMQESESRLLAIDEAT